jgi:transmembrane sensor
MGVSQMVPSEEEIRAGIAEQAGEWFVANQTGPLTPADNAAFLAWLKASPIHLQEYLGVTRAVHHLKAAAADPRVPLKSFLAQTRSARSGVVALESPTPRGQEFTSSRIASWVRPLAASTAALVLLATGALWWVHDGELLGIPKTYQTTHGERSTQGMPDGELLRIAKTYQTAHGEQITQRLADGSVLHLEADSAVTVRYSGRERLVEVRNGQVLFQVAPDTRPFWVAAGRAGVTAAAADFAVNRRISATTVTVAKGEVAVFTGQPSFLHADGASNAVQRVKAGYQTRVDATGLASEPVEMPNASDVAEKESQQNFNDGLDNRVENRALEMPRTH